MDELPFPNLDHMPAISVFAVTVGFMIRAFLSHLKVLEESQANTMTSVVEKTTEATGKLSEVIFEQSRLTGETLARLRDKQ
jgi:hypothetical protein